MAKGYWINCFRSIKDQAKVDAPVSITGTDESGATVTVLVIGDSIVRSATKLIKSGRIGGGQGRPVGAEQRIESASEALALRFAHGQRSGLSVGWADAAAG